MMEEMVNLNLLFLIFNRREQTVFVNYVTLNTFAIFLREVYLCESGKLCIFVRNETEKAFDEVKWFILHCLSL